MILAGQGARARARSRVRAAPGLREIAPDVLRHRLVLSYEALADGVSADDVIDRILAAMPVPELALRERMRARRRHRSERRMDTARTWRRDAGASPPPPRVARDPPARRPAAGELPHARSAGSGRTSATCASTSRATTSATSTGTSPRGWTPRSSASTPRIASSRRGCSSTGRRRWGSARSTGRRSCPDASSPRPLARLLTRGGNRVGAILFDNEIEKMLPPRSGRNQVLAPRHGACCGRPGRTGRSPT